MTYEEIIRNNCRYHSQIDWWPKYAFHYTDVTNAVNILKEGFLYSREDAAKACLMSNENASRQVIDMTRSGASSFVRFYFRPLTPTQYHNEGFKHPGLRYCQDANANVPVPVFFLFSLDKLLRMPETSYSQESLAGYGGQLMNGINNFAALDFDQIYKIGPMEDPSSEKKKRQAEIVFSGAFPIDSALQYIVCRNEVDRLTLINLLREENKISFSRYNSLIKVDESCFKKNGLYISACECFGDRAVIGYSSTASKIHYTQSYKTTPGQKLEVQALAEFTWLKKQVAINRRVVKFTIDYEECIPTVFDRLEKPQGATALYMRIYFENSLVCFACWHLAESAML